MGLLDSFKKKKVEYRLTKSIEAILNTPVSKIMSKYVISVQKNEKLMEAANIIVGEKVSCVVVKNGDLPVGVVTERDFLKKAPLNKEKLEQMNVNNLMSPKLITISPNTIVSEAITILVKNSFRKLVVEKNREMVGIVTQTDFVRLFDKFYDSLEVKTSDVLKMSEVMTKNVATISKGSKFSEAKVSMGEKDIGSIIILDGGSIAGIITEYDVAAEIVGDPEKCDVSLVDSIMISPVMTIDKDINIFDANRIMVLDNVRRLPITENNHLIGIVTQTDMCRAIFYFLKATLWHLNNKDIKWEKMIKTTVEKRLV